MFIFSPDLYRQFGIGFLIGAGLIGAANFGGLAEQVSSPAQAAQSVQAPQPAPEFHIQPVN